MGELVLDADPLAEARPPARGGEVLAQPVLQPLVLCDVHAAPGTLCGSGALRPQRAVITGLRIELGDGAEDDALRLARRAGDGQVAHIDLERRLREDALAPRDPGPAHDLAATPEDVVNEGGLHVAK